MQRCNKTQIGRTFRRHNIVKIIITKHNNSHLTLRTEVRTSLSYSLLKLRKTSDTLNVNPSICDGSPARQEEEHGGAWLQWVMAKDHMLLVSCLGLGNVNSSNSTIECPIQQNCSLDRLRHPSENMQSLAVFPATLPSPWAHSPVSDLSSLC